MDQIESPPAQTADLRFLLVEDNVVDQKVVQRIVRAIYPGSGLVVAESAAEAVQTLKRESDFDCVLLDHNLPDMDGLAAVESWQELPAPPKAIIMLTNVGSESLAVAALKQKSVIDYIPKTVISIEALRRALGNAISVSRLREQKKAAERQLLAKTEELERLNKALEQFASLAAHDLRGPLSSIKGFATFIKFAPDEPKTAEHAGRIMAICDRMLGIIEGMLAFARAGDANASLLPVDLNAVIRDAVDNLDEPIRESGAKIRQDPMPTVLGIPSELLQLMQNLIANAIKYAHPHRRPEIELLAGTASTGSVEISIKDNGRGIEPEDQLRVFDMLYRTADSGDVGGSGIGLALCSKIAQKHGGTIGVDSVAGRGSRFWVRLQAAEQQGAATSAAPA